MCHGKDLEGGIGPSLVDDVFAGQVGDAPDSAYYQLVRDGAEGGMPTFGSQLTEEDPHPVGRQLHQESRAGGPLGRGAMDQEFESIEGLESGETARKLPLGWLVLYWGLIAWGIFYLVMYSPCHQRVEPGGRVRGNNGKVRPARSL